MKVVHIIPAAFDYFDDIRAAAFNIVEDQSTLIEQVDAFTLQYGKSTAGKKSEGEIQTTAPSRKFAGNFSGHQLFESLPQYDLIHLHCPFFGAAGKILHWIKKNNVPLVCTYYRDVGAKDFFSLMIKFYNGYYLPKLFSVADTICYAPYSTTEKPTVNKFLRRGEKFTLIDGTAKLAGQDLTPLLNEVELLPSQVRALKYNIIYNSLLADSAGDN